MAQVSSEEIHSFIHALPKVELHIHIEGALSRTLARKLAARNNVSLPAAITSPDSKDDNSDNPSYTFHDLTSFLEVYYPAMSVLLTQHDFHDLALEYIEIARAQNVRHIEIFFDPQAHTSRGVSLTTIVSGLVSAIEDVTIRRNTGMSVKLILCFLRDHPVDSAMRTLDEALTLPSHLRQHIIGVGLDSDARGNPPIKFKDVFAKARKETDWKVTVHCDIDHEDSIEHIRQALEDLQVDRIDHGENIIEDARLVQLAIDRHVGFTECPVSNDFVCNDWKYDEIRQLAEKGVLVSINTDDPAYFGKDLDDNLAMLVHRFPKEGQDWKREVVRYVKMGIESSWLVEGDKNNLVEELEKCAQH